MAAFESREKNVLLDLLGWDTQRIHEAGGKKDRSEEEEVGDHLLDRSSLIEPLVPLDGYGVKKVEALALGKWHDCCCDEAVARNKC
jgi:hypothetical protein